MGTSAIGPMICPWWQQGGTAQSQRWWDPQLFLSQQCDDNSIDLNNESFTAHGTNFEPACTIPSPAHQPPSLIQNSPTTTSPTDLDVPKAVQKLYLSGTDVGDGVSMGGANEDNNWRSTRGIQWKVWRENCCDRPVDNHEKDNAAQCAWKGCETDWVSRGI